MQKGDKTLLHKGCQASVWRWRTILGYDASVSELYQLHLQGLRSNDVPSRPPLSVLHRRGPILAAAAFSPSFALRRPLAKSICMIITRRRTAYPPHKLCGLEPPSDHWTDLRHSPVVLSPLTLIVLVPFYHRLSWSALEHTKTSTCSAHPPQLCILTSAGV